MTCDCHRYGGYPDIEAQIEENKKRKEKLTLISKLMLSFKKIRNKLKEKK